MTGLWDGTLAAVIGGMSGALAGVVSTLLTNKANRAASRIEKRIDDIEAIAELLRVEAIAYWSTSGTGQDTNARKIINLWETLVSRVSVLAELGSEVGDLARVNVFVDQLYDLITGTDFQAKTRSADQTKVADIRHLCLGLCSELHVSRRVVNRYRRFWNRRTDEAVLEVEEKEQPRHPAGRDNS
jgi:hypothetical protein